MTDAETTAVRNPNSRDRGNDKGFWCALALRFSQAWDFIDDRDIDKHLMSWAVFGMTIYVIFWMLEFIWSHADKPGLEVGAIVAAIMIPWNGVQAAVVKWYFAARTE